MSTHRPGRERQAEGYLTRLAAQPFSVNGLSTSQQVFSGRCVLMGWALVNTGGAALNVEFYDGQDTKGTECGALRMAATSDDHQQFGPDGILCEIGLYMVLPAAGVIGAVYYRAVVDDTPY